MKIDEKYFKVIKWSARIASLAVLLLGLPFYFGYGNPLPFVNPNNTFMDNVWLSVFPLMFIGLGLGWKKEKIAGYLITVPIVIATILGLFMIKEFLPGPMYMPFIIGILYLISGYKKELSK